MLQDLYALNLRAIRNVLPKTYFSDRSTYWRVKHIVEDWRKLTVVNQELEAKLDKMYDDYLKAIVNLKFYKDLARPRLRTED
jgi:hypothetical protein